MKLKQEMTLSMVGSSTKQTTNGVMVVLRDEDSNGKEDYQLTAAINNALKVMKKAIWVAVIEGL